MCALFYCTWHCDICFTILFTPHPYHNILQSNIYTNLNNHNIYIECAHHNLTNTNTKPDNKASASEFPAEHNPPQHNPYCGKQRPGVCIKICLCVPLYTLPPNIGECSYFWGGMSCACVFLLLVVCCLQSRCPIH